MKWLVIAVVLVFVGYVAFSGGDDEAEVAPVVTAAPAVPGAAVGIVNDFPVLPGHFKVRKLRTVNDQQIYGVR